jgi:glucokinase
MKHILTADIGGTNSRFGHFTVDENERLVLAEARWLKTTDADSFGHLFDNLNRSGFSLLPDAADIVVMAVAGPIEDGTRSRPPLIAWDIDLTALHDKEIIRKSLLINDFVAQAFACRSKAAEEAEQILSGFPVPNAPVAAIGAGTGLGKALLVHDEKGGYRAIPSEGGHTNFPFLAGRESVYQEFLLKELHEQYITGNTVVSGKGLSYLHRFLTGRIKEPADVVKEFSSYPETHAWAAKFYARVCRNYVLETLCLGGLYVAGGLAARAPELLRHPEFEKEFRSSDTMARLLAQVPVYLIRDENSGLWGGAVLARQKLREATDA